MHDRLSVAIVHLLLTGVSVLLVAQILPGIRVRSYISAVVFAFITAVLNAIGWYLLAPFTWTFTVLTLGIGWFIVNGFIFLLAGALIPGIEISGCFTAALASLGVQIVNWAMHFIFGKWAP